MTKREDLCIGIDIGAAHVRAAVVDADGRVLGQEKHRLQSREPPQVAEAVVRAAKTACGAAGLPFGEIKAMGLGLAGMIQKGTGLVLGAPSLGWREVPFVKLLQARVPKLPLLLANDLSVVAWGERAAGAGRGVDDLLVVLAGTGLGAGLILGGRLQEGATGIAGELGHVVVHPNGRLCACGKRGCLEAYAGGQSLAAWARDDLRIALAAARAAGKPNTVGKRLLEQSGNDLEKITAAAMERAAHEGDELSRRLLEDAGRMLGVVLANLITVLNPARLLLGGGVLVGSPRMMRAVTEAIDAHASKSSRAALHVSQPALGEQACVVGAALLARETLAQAA
jgi:glucokinase